MKSRIIHTKFWTDPYIRKLKPDEKFFYMYLLLNEFTNVLHIFELPLDIVIQQTTLSSKKIQAIKEKLRDDGKIDFVDDYVFLLNAYKYQEYRGIKNNNAKLRIIYEMSTNAIAHFKEFLVDEVASIKDESEKNNVTDVGFLNLLARVDKRLSIKIPLDRGIGIQPRNQNTEIKIQKSENIKQKPEYNSVESLTDEVLQTISEEYRYSMEVLRGYVKKIKLYCESNGKSYKNYKATLLNWLDRDFEAGKVKKVTAQPKRQDQEISPEQRAENLRKLAEVKAGLLANKII